MSRNGRKQLRLPKPVRSWQQVAHEMRVRHGITLTPLTCRDYCHFGIQKLVRKFRGEELFP